MLGHLDSLPGPQAAALSSALALGPAVSSGRLAIGAATLGLLAAAADDWPLCLLVDDAQWLDGPSAEAVLFAARRLLADPVAIIVAVRTGEASPLADAGLPALELRGLDLDTSEALLALERGGPVPDGSAERLFRATGGNPLALIELAGEAEAVAGSLVETPLAIATTVERAFAGRIARLSDQARRSLLLAAAASNADLGLLAAASRLLAIDIAALQEAEAAGLIAIADGRARFRHPLVRSAVHNAADPVERREVHAALARELDDERHADERAWHLGLAAFGPDDEAADALAQAAGRARERGAYSAAALTAERSARLTANDAVRGQRLVEAASNAWIAGGGERAVSLLDEAASLAVDGDVALDSAHLRGHVGLARGDALAAREVFIGAAKLAEVHDARRAALLWAEASYASFSAGHVEGMLEDARAARAVLPRNDSGPEACMAQLALGMALVFSGADDEGPRMLRSAVAMESYGRLLDGPALLWRWSVEAPLFLREARTARESFTSAHRSRTRSRNARRALADPLPLGARRSHDRSLGRGPCALLRGGRSRPRHGPARRGVRGALGPGLARGARGQEESCRAHAADAIGLAREYGRSLYEAWALAALGDLELALGKPAEAVERLTTMQGLLERLGIGDVDLSPAPELAEALVQCGRGAEAAAVAGDYRRRAAAKGQPWALARAARAEGLVADDESFASWFEQGLRWHESTPDTFERARSELAYGERLRRVRRRGDARSHLRAAFAAFRQLGAEPWAERARLELAASGETTRKRDPSTIDQLTPRELQIALDLASGLTTREAAAKLYLSPKTVEFHLRSVYRKLGIASRAQLTEAFARADQS